MQVNKAWLCEFVYSSINIKHKWDGVCAPFIPFSLQTEICNKPCQGHSPAVITLFSSAGQYLQLQRRILKEYDLEE